ncbi:MAG: hypothetical protein KKF33_12570 [Alphaproteobacteria bacterium]|nr:hypothetical protein [Alphaproteobacteria bacterium]
MSEDWAAIAAEVEGALRSIGDVSQPDGYPATIRRVVPGTPDPAQPWLPSDPTITYTTVRVIVFDKELRDINGTLIGMTKRTITILGAAGIAPTDDDTIAEGTEAADADENSAWKEIVKVMPLAPAGIAVLYELELAS